MDDFADRIWLWLDRHVDAASFIVVCMGIAVVIVFAGEALARR